MIYDTTQIALAEIHMDFHVPKFNGHFLNFKPDLVLLTIFPYYIYLSLAQFMLKFPYV